MRILIWDSPDPPPNGGYDHVLLWQSYEDFNSPFVFSLPKLVEENSDALRKQYLKFVYDLGIFEHNKKSLVDHFEIRPCFSYWWMTLLAEKSNWAKSPSISSVIRFFAFDEWSKDLPSTDNV